jgi:hypothetical protein
MNNSLLKENGLWVTQSGEQVLVIGMSDGHLVNTLRMLKRVAMMKLNIAISLYMHAPPLQGEMAQDAFDREFDDLLRKDWKECYDKLALNVFLSEADKRGLQWESGIASLWV